MRNVIWSQKYFNASTATPSLVAQFDTDLFLCVCFEPYMNTRVRNS